MPTSARIVRPWSPAHHLAVIDDDLVVLDLAADRYACLPSVGTAIVLDPGARTLASRSPSLMADLVDTGVLAEAPMRPRVEPRAWPGAQRRSLYPDRPATPRRRHLRQAWPVLALALWRYRGASLEAIVAWAAAARPAAAPLAAPLTADLEACVADFHAWAAYAPVSGKCLLRSFLLLAQLRRAGLDALWVFGVATWPFAAHCWLQCGDVVLDDVCEHVARFQPILVV
jgi:anti-sigma-K factor RskA